jgi:hypothetical protein
MAGYAFANPPYGLKDQKSEVMLSRASVELAFYSLGTQHVTVSLPPEPVLS